MSWQIDKAHSHIQFSVSHMMITKVRGFFDSFSGSVEFDEEDPSKTSVAITIDAASIYTRDEKRDGHLRSPDFLNVEEYPELIFVSKRVEQDDDNNGRLIGDLTIAGQTHEVVLNVHYVGTGISPWGSEQAGFTGRTKISRKDWGLEWNQALETGGWLVGDKITIDVELQLTKVPEAELAAV